MEKILHLTLKKKWFDMIASGEKKEEYREIKPYWHSRLCCGFPTYQSEKDFDYVIFKNGYSKEAKTIKVEWRGMAISEGKIQWGAYPSKNYYVIQLGKIISKNF